MTFSSVSSCYSGESFIVLTFREVLESLVTSTPYPSGLIPTLDGSRCAERTPSWSSILTGGSGTESKDPSRVVEFDEKPVWPSVRDVWNRRMVKGTQKQEKVYANGRFDDGRSYIYVCGGNRCTARRCGSYRRTRSRTGPGTGGRWPETSLSSRCTAGRVTGRGSGRSGRNVNRRSRTRTWLPPAWTLPSNHRGHRRSSGVVPRNTRTPRRCMRNGVISG